MSNLGELNKVLIQGPLLVTGHTGFKGSWLILLLEKLGIEWIGMSLPPTHNSLYNSIKLNNKQNEYFIDIRDYYFIHRAYTFYNLLMILIGMFLNGVL